VTSDCIRRHVYQKAADGEGFNYLKNASNLQFSDVIANPSQSTAFWCCCHYLLWNTQQFYDWEGWCWDEVSSLHPGDLGACPPQKFWNLQAQKRVCRFTESNLSQIRAQVKCPSHCLVVFVVQWLSTLLILTLLLTPTPLLTYPNPIRLGILFNFRVCRLTKSNLSSSQMSESLFNCLCRFNDLVP
jgi:hypothetical protein